MAEKQAKKLLIIYVLDILNKYSDADHKLSQKDIEDLLRTKYDMTVDRKSVKRNLEELIEFGERFGGIDIRYDVSVRRVPVKNPDGSETFEESEMYSNFYVVRPFTDGELCLLIDGLMFSRHVPKNQCREMVEKLEGLSNVYFRTRMKHIARDRLDKIDKGANQDIFLNIEVLDEAISKKHKVSFKYLEYRTDKKQYPRKRSDGSEEYVVSPYQIVARDGKYYLICSLDGHDRIANYRIDRIRNAKILKDKVRPFESLDRSDGNPLDVAEYMKKSPYMYADENRHAKLRIARYLISEVIEMFGSDVTFGKEDEASVEVNVYAAKMSIIHFAKGFAPSVTILSPDDMAEEIKGDLRRALEQYE